MSTVLGLKRGSVRVVPHNPSWRGLFEAERTLLQKLAGEDFVALEHIGSTAVAGIHAKPIIDMQLGLTSLATLDTFRKTLEEEGYAFRENGSDSMRLLFVKGPEDNRTHHLHITTYGSDAWRVALLFRDCLQANPDVAHEYNRLKMDLASRHADDRELYTAHKKGFIENVLTKLKETVTPGEGVRT